MIELTIFVGLLALIILVSLYSRHKLRKKRKAKSLRGIKQLTQVLDLIQKLQMHRGVCANLTDDNRRQQQSLCQEVEQLWQPLLDRSYDGNMKRVSLQHNQWQKIAASPANSFMAHCELIEKLLHELTVIADTCALTATNNSHDQDALWQNLLLRPHFAESLARLRGLGSKAANAGECPAAIRVQLQYLLLNLRDSDLNDQGLQQIDTLVNEEILQPERIQIDSRVYFNRLTQAIDMQIQQTRDHLQQLS